MKTLRLDQSSHSIHLTRDCVLNTTKLEAPGRSEGCVQNLWPSIEQNANVRDLSTTNFPNRARNILVVVFCWEQNLRVFPGIEAQIWAFFFSIFYLFCDLHLPNTEEHLAVTLSTRTGALNTGVSRGIVFWRVE